jgi:hypothetical protein
MHQRPTLELYNTDTAATMKAYIREHFSELLGPYEVLLDQPGGLDLLAEMVRSGQIGRDRVA